MAQDKGQDQVKHTLRFWNPSFHKRVNVTIRRGDQWARARPGDVLNIHATNNPEVGILYRAQVLGMAVVPFALLPQSWIEMEHDVRCQSRAGLLFAMQAIYPGFQASENVTAIHFSLVS